jgi:hypothetical protein
MVLSVGMITDLFAGCSASETLPGLPQTSVRFHETWRMTVEAMPISFDNRAKKGYQKKLSLDEARFSFILATL